jgi:signal transduction histidine kinase
VYYALGYPDGPAFLAALVALFGAVVAGHRAAARVVLAGAYLVYICIGWVVPGLPRVDWAHALLVAVWLLVAYGFAEAVRVRAANVAEMARARAAWQRAQAERERARAEQQRRRASEERLRIARELHDVLGHHLSLISVQAGVGLHLMDERPEQARAALVAIKQASAEALREVRSVLDAMRPQDESAPRSPAPGLSDVDDLLAGVRAAGFTVRYVSTGLERALPAEVDRAAYRIAQEALTNVRRHAGAGATAELRLDYGPDRLVVHVVDDGVGATHPADGNGIAGMRERAAALGGTLIARARPGGGFEVAADLPIPDDVPAAEFLLTPEQERP